MEAAALLLVLCALACPHPLLARVVGDDEDGFAECNVFFKDQSPPEGFGGPSRVKICQKYNGEPRFATLYSTENKIPVYSAFRYREAAPSQGEGWLLEAQLDDPENAAEEMMEEAEAKESIGELGLHQSLNEDYTDPNYQPFTLNPGFLNEGDYQRATYTLTNAVPVPQSFRKSWSLEVGHIVKEALVQQCENGEDLYFVTGAVPSDETVNNKIAVPESLWLAACCNTAEAWSMGFIQKNNDVKLESLSMEELKKHLPEEVNIFTNPCGEGTENAQQSKVLETINQRRAEEAEEATGPFFRFIRFLARVVYGIVKTVFYIVWFFIEQIFNIIAGGICCLWDGAVSYLLAISGVLGTIPIDIIRVIGNILMGCVRTINNVLTVVGMILRVPLRFLLDLGNFPYLTLCAIPTVGKEIAVGVFGSLGLLIDSIFSLTGSSYSVTSFACNRFLQRLPGFSGGSDE
ncbi:endonuclease domain-containing 1 protein [Ambystoma mexicanum]|uniref:endonuclease domain-containing 1 protein n=1 Tax=Ambystoma mexicanum TaxID=8296 RepID=UPI0037E7BFCC